MIEQQQIKVLAEQALLAQKRAIVPISHFAVGAALMAEDGKIFLGCNIECYGQTPTICAERVALFKALSEQVVAFKALAVTGGKFGEEPDDYCLPCGVCRQVLMQVCSPDLPIYIVKNIHEIQSYTLSQLLPYAWTRKGDVKK